MGRRTILLVSALLVAALGTLLVYLYVRGADHRADAGRRTQTVLVATATIPAGTTGDQAAAAGSFASKAITADSVAAGALTDIGPVRSLVALSTVYPGQQLVRAAFGALQGTTSIPVPTGDMALSIQLGDPQRVAGFLGAGSQVAVFATIPAPTSSAGTGTTAAGGNVTTLLLRKVQVITVGNIEPVPDSSTSSTGSDSTITKAIVTLAVTQAQAQKLIYAQSRGELYLALVSDSTTEANLPPTTSQNLLD
jgi:pilus assembly protein CpaB